MPLNTQLVRAGNKPFGLSLDSEGKGVGWSAWHLNRLADAIIEENPEAYDGDELIDREQVDKIGPFPYGYVFKTYHSYTELETNIWDRGGAPGVFYTLEIFPGDTYNCWR